MTTFFGGLYCPTLLNSIVPKFCAKKGIRFQAASAVRLHSSRDRQRFPSRPFSHTCFYRTSLQSRRSFKSSTRLPRLRAPHLRDRSVWKRCRHLHSTHDGCVCAMKRMRYSEPDDEAGNERDFTKHSWSSSDTGKTPNLSAPHSERAYSDFRLRTKPAEQVLKASVDGEEESARRVTPDRDESSGGVSLGNSSREDDECDGRRSSTAVKSAPAASESSFDMVYCINKSDALSLRALEQHVRLGGAEKSLLEPPDMKSVISSSTQDRQGPSSGGVQLRSLSQSGSACRELQASVGVADEDALDTSEDQPLRLESNPNRRHLLTPSIIAVPPRAGTVHPNSLAITQEIPPRTSDASLVASLNESDARQPQSPSTGTNSRGRVSNSSPGLRHGHSSARATHNSKESNMSTLTVRYDAHHTPNESAEGLRCAICLELFSHLDRQTFLPCLHSFHKHCISRWFRQSYACPVCQLDIREGARLAQEPRGPPPEVRGLPQHHRVLDRPASPAVRPSENDGNRASLRGTCNSPSRRTPGRRRHVHTPARTRRAVQRNTALPWFVTVPAASRAASGPDRGSLCGSYQQGSPEERPSRLRPHVTITVPVPSSTAHPQQARSAAHSRPAAVRREGHSTHPARAERPPGSSVTDAWTPFADHGDSAVPLRAEANSWHPQHDNQQRTGGAESLCHSHTVVQYVPSVAPQNFIGYTRSHVNTNKSIGVVLAKAPASGVSAPRWPHLFESTRSGLVQGLSGEKNQSGEKSRPPLLPHLTNRPLYRVPPPVRASDPPAYTPSLARMYNRVTYQDHMPLTRRFH